MKAWIAILVFYFGWNVGVDAQKFQVDTLFFNGSSEKFINFVFMGDGYTASEQDKFILDAQNIISYMFGQTPWNQYSNYFNAFAIQVISNESGAIHPNTAPDCNTAKVPVSNPDNYFKSSFDNGGIHRLIVPGNYSRVVQVLASNFPNYDQVIILVNSPYYGGSGGTYATLTTDKNSAEVAIHEIGHSFAKLTDEYWAGDIYAREGANMTKETDPDKVKWRNWMGNDGIGIYQHCCGDVASMWYRPHQNCKMRVLNTPFCNVCVETIIERIHVLVNPIVSYYPVGNFVKVEDSLQTYHLTELIKPKPNTLHIQWILDNEDIAKDTDSIVLDQKVLSFGKHNLTAIVTDTTHLLRVDGHSKTHFNTVTWEIEKTKTTGTIFNTRENTIGYELYPNPTSDFLNISISCQQPLEDVKIAIYTMDGRLMHAIEQNIGIVDKFERSVSIDALPVGNYILSIQVKNIMQSLPFQKY
ncbi:MAG: T9SS type A sorting domain-containing protein [Chitinophagales bacterium]|nr:T9SS type A sorting domain-containing protein [Chitinophagales bacterium]